MRVISQYRPAVRDLWHPIDMSESSDRRVDEALQRIERELQEQAKALALLGLRQCSCCRKYLRYDGPGAVFVDAGELVCYKCVHDWWLNKSPQLPITDRTTIEQKLVHWLIYQHHAKVIKQTGKVLDNLPEGLRLVAGCIECNGLGKDTARGPCSYCNGTGTVWVVLAD